MAEKPKNRPARVHIAIGTAQRDRITGQFVAVKKSAAGNILTQSPTRVTDGGRSVSASKPKIQPHPTGEDVDIDQFVQDLLVSDKDIMDYLAR